MKTFLQFLTDSENEYVYHGTASRHLDSIRQHGLKATPDNSNWNVQGRKKDVVYFSHNEKTAIGYAHKSAGDKDNPLILRVHKDHVDLTSDLPKSYDDHWSEAPVKPEHIQMKHENEWKPIKA